MEIDMSSSADYTSFKVVLTDYSRNSVSKEVRRFVVARDVSANLQYLKRKIATLYSQLNEYAFQLVWLDQEGDRVSIGSHEELVIALSELIGPIYHLEILANGPKNDQTAQGHHVGVECDHCDRAVVGFRYKCVSCPDYDLCSRCESQGIHHGHNMVRIPTPEDAWPRHFCQRVHKMFERMQRPTNGRDQKSSKAALSAKSEIEKDAQDERVHETSSSTRKIVGGVTPEPISDDEWTVIKNEEEFAAASPSADINSVKCAQIKDRLPMVNSANSYEIRTDRPGGKSQVTPQGLITPPNPKIRVALQVLLKMGYDNEGNWLARLLEVKNGNVEKALDALQSV